MKALMLLAAIALSACGLIAGRESGWFAALGWALAAVFAFADSLSEK